jgi:DNA primase
MSLPPGFLDELRDRLTLSAVAGRKVMWDRRKTNAAKGDFWAPCPFHQEKTPSFHVDDRKGFYYCFGCQATGDAITFVKETENVSFIEAVEILAREAGMAMPEQRHDPQAAERQDRRTRLAEVMEQAVQLYGLAFRSAAGQGARDYAARRGLTAETLKRFEIGFAPDSRNHQTQAFRDKGLLDEAVGAGLLIRPDDGGAPYDRFRGRLMFPIRDPRGRCIAFGGRALDPYAQAKYLNSPETELFHKGRTLYNHGPAREAAGKAGTLIVAEGYMDVIALSAAGFDHAVAPLGTAITEDQLQLIWRLAEEPVIALDGDEAGLRAANRVVDLALPLLVPGKSLRFCILPEGQDPDDLIRTGGPEAVRVELERALPLIEMLWRRERIHRELNTPERWAELEVRIDQTTGRIRDPKIRNLYSRELRARIKNLQWEVRSRGRTKNKKGLDAQTTTSAPLTEPARLSKSIVSKANSRKFEQPTTLNEDLDSLDKEGRQIKNLKHFFSERYGRNRSRNLKRKHAEVSARHSISHVAQSDARIREAGILLIACHNPRALGPVEHALEEMTLRTPEFAALRDALLAALAEEADVAETVRARTGQDPFALLERLPQARAHPLARPGAPSARVAELLAEAIERHQAALAFEAELADATRDLGAAEGEDWTWRVRQAGHVLHEAERRGGAAADETEAQVVSDIRRMLDAEVYKTKKR